MATFKDLPASSVTTNRSFLNQLVDMIQEDISGSATRKKYQVFITGGVGPGVTSSLFQTVFDQAYSLQTANAIFDMTVGIRSGSGLVLTASTGVDASGKTLFSSQSLMMREKIENYSQFSQLLLGKSSESFYAKWKSVTSTDQIDNAMFINFRRLFARDKIKRETFAMRFYQTASVHLTKPNLRETTVTGSVIFTDVGSAANRLQSFSGEVGNIVDSTNTSNYVGLMFYDAGIAVFDLDKILDTNQNVSGVIAAMSNTTDGVAGPGRTVMSGTFAPNFLVSGSIDNIVDHLAETRFSSGTLTAATFQNITQINSTLIFCNAGVNEFNYSSNPTYTDADGKIVVVTEGDTEERPFSFITTVGLYDANSRLLAVAKLSRPIEKNDERELTVRVRLDF